MTVRLKNHILHKLLMCIALVLSNSGRFRFEECRADLMQGHRKIPMRTGVPAEWGIRGAGAALALK